MLPLTRAAIAAFLACGSQLSAAVTLYALETFENRLYRVDSEALGSPQWVGTIGSGAGPDLSELIVASSQALYTIDRASKHILTISTTDASVAADVPIDVVITTHPRGFDMSPDGILYGVIGNPFPGPSIGRLLTIDPLTGAVVLGPILSGALGLEAIAFALDGTLFGAGSPITDTESSHLYTIDLATGAMNLIGDTGVDDIDTMTYFDGFLYGADSLEDVDADLYRIDPRNGIATVLGMTGVTGLNGLAAVSGIPEPPVLLLATSAIAVLAGLRGHMTQQSRG